MKNENFTIVLVFPPVWIPEAPYLSTAILSGYLKERGITVFQKDLNVEFWGHFYQEDKIADIYISLQNKWQQLQNIKNSLTSYEFELLNKIACVVDLSSDRFIYEVKNHIIATDFYRQLVQGVSEFNYHNISCDYENVISHEDVKNYHDLFYNDISLSRFASDSSELNKIIQNKDKNPFISFFEQYSLNSITEKKPHIIGISIAAQNQVVPGLTFANLIKMKFPDVYTVVGGSWCSYIKSNIEIILNKMSCIDFVIVNEGEKPLFQLCEALREKKDVGNIPDLFYREENAIKSNGLHSSVDMDSLPVPDFDDISIEKYDNVSTVQIQASRGCYWGKCIFCSYSSIEPHYKVRSVDQVVNDIVSLKSKYGFNCFNFSDALISPSYCEKLSRELIRREVNVRWSSLARLETQFDLDKLKLMSRSGCHLISWGLESADKDVLKTIRKNIDITMVTQILKNAAECGIQNRILAMYGLPNESYMQAQKTLSFIRENINHIHSISFNLYHPEKNTAIEQFAESKSIKLISREESDIGIDYLWFGEMTEREINSLEREYRLLNNRISCIHNHSQINILKAEQDFSFRKKLSFNSQNIYVHSFISNVNNLPVRCFLKEIEGE